MAPHERRHHTTSKRSLEPMTPYESKDPETVARDVLDSLLEGCQVIGFDWTYVYVNDALERQARKTKDELLGKTMMECFPGIEHTRMFETLRRCMTVRTHASTDNEFVFPDGTKGWFDLRFLPVPEGICILSLDVTESRRTQSALRRSEEQVRQMQKMEAVSRLACGVAHDFNNLLSVILSYAEMLRAGVFPGDAQAADLGEIIKAGERAARLTRQLLGFSHQRVLSPQIVDLNDLVSGMERMLLRLIPENIETRIRLDPDLDRVNADPGPLEQILLNLVVNARDAMPAGGKLLIETQNIEIDPGYAAEHLGTSPGPHVMLAVSDNGVGMDRATQSRIFEPFFTTKEVGKGTGLGLTTVFSIARQNGGSVWVYSEPGRGSTFKVYLPSRRESADLPTVPKPAVSCSGSETILVVEDDEQVRRLACGILARSGYRIIEAQNGAEAFRICRDSDLEIHLILTDVIMPEMGGVELGAEVAKIRPSIRILFASGYTDDAMLANCNLSVTNTFLVQKPFTPDALLRKVRQVLDAS